MCWSSGPLKPTGPPENGAAAVREEERVATGADALGRWLGNGEKGWRPTQVWWEDTWALVGMGRGGAEIRRRATWTIHGHGPSEQWQCRS